MKYKNNTFSNDKLVSIVIPNYNSAAFILETLKSIQLQTYMNWECIVVDDFSTDASCEIISKFIQTDSRFRLEKRPIERTKGANACRNYGLEISTGEYVNWFDSDDVMLPNFISSKIEALNETTSFVIASSYFTNHDFTVKKYISLDYKDNLFKEYLMWRFKIVTNSVLFKKSFLVENNFTFNEQIFKGQEMELFSRIFFYVHNHSSIQFQVLDIPTFLYRGHSESSTSKNLNYNPQFKSSETYTLIRNLDLCLSLRDDELIQSRYRLLINILKKGVDNNHKENIERILNFIESTFCDKNYFKVKLLKFVVYTFFYLRLNFLPWDKVLKKIAIRY